MASAAHSAKTLETIRLLGVTPSGWSHAPIRWVKVKMLLPTSVDCPKCHGRGVIYPDHRTTTKCPTCPTKRGWSGNGTGKVTKLVEREVEVGYIEWPKGTVFDSRFRGNGNCELCSKSIRNFVPVMVTDAKGVVHGLWVGGDCARTLLHVSSMGTTMDEAKVKADERSTERRMWREVPKPPKPVKPVKPSLSNVAEKDALDAKARELFGALFESSSYYLSRAKLEYGMLFRYKGNVGSWIKLTVDARFGVTVKPDYDPKKKHFLKVKDSQDIMKALETAGPEILTYLQATLDRRA